MIFVDANALLEILLPGRRQQRQVIRRLSRCPDLALSTLTIHLLVYFCRREGVQDGMVHALIQSYHIVSLLPEDYVWARDNEKGRDFEDALQVAAAVRSGCTQIITLDQDLAKNYQKIIPCIVP